ncbi:MAG: hypothetical protein ACPGRE_07790 [Flavobacteriaceae bacterium]
MRKLIVLSFMLGAIAVSYGQTLDSLSIAQTPQSTPRESANWTFDFNGYLKYMQTLGFASGYPMQVDNLVHNRLNFEYYNDEGSTLVLQMRNRIFYGASVSNIPGYGDYVTSYDGVLPLEYLLVDNESVVINSIVDRFYYEYATDDFQIRVGRQRINWGINTTWNPNDLFNSYNIYDFDYEEREGADAIRATFFPGLMSSIDVAYKFTGDFDTDIFAAKYKFNKSNYDFQFLAGKFQESIALGTGWAGSIGTLGFKGEFTAFQSYKNWEDQTNLSFSTSLDYSWANGFYLLGTYLYNTTGSTVPIDPTAEVVQVPNAEYLMPAAHNLMLSGSYMINPILSTSTSAIYAPGLNSFTFFPTLTLSVMTDLDLDLVGQFFWQELPENEDFANIGNGVYWRLKYSF